MGIYLTKKNTTTNKVEKFKVAGNSGDSHPVGSIYMSTENTSPASMFGGIWEQIKDKFLLSAGDTYSAGATGGEATHTLTINEMPEHNHQVYVGTSGQAGDIPSITNAVREDVKMPNWFTYTVAEGGSQAHNNMPPYLVVYCWKRIS